MLAGAGGKLIPALPCLRNNTKNLRIDVKNRSRTFSYVLTLDISLTRPKKITAASFIDFWRRESCYVNLGIAFLGSSPQEKDENLRIDVRHLI